jgi:hypothetical protein
MNSTTRINLVVNKVPLHEQKSDAVYWRSQSYEDRLAALEQIRQEFHRWKSGAEPRLQKVYTITKMGELRANYCEAALR